MPGTRNWTRHSELQLGTNQIDSIVTRGQNVGEETMEHTLCAWKSNKNRSTKIKKVEQVWITNEPVPELYITFHLHYISFALHLKILPCQHEMHDMSRFKCQTTFISWNANVMQNPLFNQVFVFFEQLLPCQVAILQHLRDMEKALQKLKQQLY